MASRQIQSKSACNRDASRRPTRARQRATLGRLLGLTAVALLSSCASGPSSHDPGRGKEPAVEATSEVISPDGILVCPSGGDKPDAWISVTAMNNKLQHYPDFARASGLTEVKSCADGFSFWKAYSKYQATAPYFDANEPFEVPDRAGADEEGAPPLTEADYRAAEGTGPKIKSGTGALLSPVVRIYIEKNNGNGARHHYCTGSFIGRNWILTAAHCLQVKPGWVKGRDNPDTADLNAGYYKYDIEFFGADGKSKTIKTFANTQQVMDKRYTGWNPGDPYHSHDFALLYISKEFDGMLPNMDRSLSVDKFPMMRVSLADHLVDVPNASFWGAGLIDNHTIVQTPPSGGSGGSSGGGGSGGGGGTGGTAGVAGFTVIAHESGENESRLRYGSLRPFETSFTRRPETPYLSNGPGSPEIPHPVKGSLFYAEYPSSPPPSNTAYVCHGDSGGPLTELWLVKDQNGNPSTSYVAAGVLSEMLFYNGIQCSQDSDCQGGPLQAGVCDQSISQCLDEAWACADGFGRGAGWVPTVYEKDWIQRSISAWYKSKFRCTTGQRIDSGGNLMSEQYLQCWGKPCKYTAANPAGSADPDACGPQEYCYRPGSELKKAGLTCLPCANGATDCSCYYGQCFPLKK